MSQFALITNQMQEKNMLRLTPLTRFGLYAIRTSAQVLIFSVVTIELRGLCGNYLQSSRSIKSLYTIGVLFSVISYNSVTFC